MKLHPRHKIVGRARAEISEAVSDSLEKHGLTYGELMSILSNEIRAWAGLMIKTERDESEDKTHGA